MKDSGVAKTVDIMVVVSSILFSGIATRREAIPENCL